MKQKIVEMQKELDLSNKKLVDQFFTDHLSSLPNLYKLRSDMEDDSDFTLIILNIDNFKILNNFYGFVVGDYILESVASTLHEKIEDSIVYRVASDEFAILLKKRLSFYALKTYLKNMSNLVSHLQFSYAETQIYVDSTLSSCASHMKNNIFSKANMALKYAKERQLDFWIYEDEMDLDLQYRNNLEFATKIRNALDHGGLIPYFQPIIDNKTEKIVKYEALARLMDSDGVLHSPDMFIPASKTIKVYDKITKIIIEKTFETFKNSNLNFSINLSFDDIINQNIYDFIIEKLIDYNFGPRVTFELLESERVTDFKKVLRFFNEVRRYGGKIAIDDFGSGFSNFSYMIEMSPDYIKLDGSLIKNIDKDKNSKIIVETIVSFAKKMNIETIAEYVHSSTILSIVKNMEIDYSQGFYIDKPKPDIVI